MARSSGNDAGTRKKPHLRTPEAQENYMITLAMDLAERKLKDGSASSQVITHFLELATIKSKLQNEKLKSDLDVAQAKIKQMESQEDIKTLYENAMTAFRSYSGISDDGTDFEEDEYYEDDY